MTLTAHIKTLEKQKLELEDQIYVESSRPMPDFIMVQELKRKKMRIKEKIHALVHQRQPELDCA